MVNPNNTTTAWQGIGISAPVGTPVKAVSAGTVALAEKNGTFGLTIVLHHGSGDYSVYSSLSKLMVTSGEKVTKGQVIGQVGSRIRTWPPTCTSRFARSRRPWTRSSGCARAASRRSPTDRQGTVGVGANQHEPLYGAAAG